MTWNKRPTVAADDALDTDHGRLRELGYKQELKRHLSVVSDFSICFTVISVLTGVTTLYNTGLAFGGPATMTLGWFVDGAFTMAVGLSMAEICSAFPTSGGLYYWSARLSGDRWAPFASWITGWFNIVGQWAGTASIDFSLAQLIQVIVLLSTGGNNGGGYLASKYVVFAFHAVILLSHAIINSLSITWLSFFGQIAALWNMLVSRQPRRVPGDGIGRDNCNLHCLCTANPLPCDAGAQELRARPIEPWLVQCACRLGRRPLGGNHHRSLLVAGLIPGDQGHSQLHSGCCWWAVHPHSIVMDHQRATLVQGTHHKFGRIRWYGVLVG
ncbi:hypothetical protein PVAP13_8KG037065 [Panicum virgatum]|uniref:Uncharacterized protein n=1 Tax=Panicum virgatum TaxID=38727 RepID=A0A8T0PCA4_PANVG|nr:hypothetical protein PVAP13_8KG037065 [Panicum virgatum]